MLWFVHVDLKLLVSFDFSIYYINYTHLDIKYFVPLIYLCCFQWNSCIIFVCLHPERRGSSIWMFCSFVKFCLLIAILPHFHTKHIGICNVAFCMVIAMPILLCTIARALLIEFSKINIHRSVESRVTLSLYLALKPNSKHTKVIPFTFFGQAQDRTLNIYARKGRQYFKLC